MNQNDIIIAHTAVRYVAGFHWTLRFGGPRIWKPWGLEGTFIVLHDPSLPATLFGVNVVALAIGLYLSNTTTRHVTKLCSKPPEQLS